MKAYTFTLPTEFVGPFGCVVSGDLAIRFAHSEAEPENNAPEGITIEAVVVVIGAYTGDFDGDHNDAALVSACREHLAAERERVECERADMERDERHAGGEQ